MANKADFPYLHGFSQEEQKRLTDQAKFAEYEIYRDINFSRHKHILEVGCGVGAQSEILLRRFPNIKLTGIDLNTKQLDAAKKSLAKFPYFDNRYELLEMNAEKLEFDHDDFDGAFLCWVLEHIPSPLNVLSEIRRVMKKGSSIFITEVLNSSFFLDPYSPNLWKYWMAFNDYQFENAGDPFVGAKLGNLLLTAGYTDIQTKSKTWHFDNRQPNLRKETIEFWTNLLMSAKAQLIKEKAVSEEIANKAHDELKAVARDPNAVFYFTFIQASAKV